MRTAILLLILLLPLTCAYTDFSDPLAGFQVPSSLVFQGAEQSKTLTITVADDAVYRTGYYALSGSQAWTPFNFSQTATNGWILGTASRTLTIPKGASSDNYIIVYTCSKATTWDCHLNQWQIRQFTTSADESLEASWNFESGAGGTLHGASIVQDPERGAVLALDGQDDYLDVGTFSITTDELTLAAWFNIENIPSDKDPRVISKGDTQDYQDWALLISRDDYPEFRYNHGAYINDGIVNDLGPSVTLNTWHHIAGVYEGGQATLYYDGEEIASRFIEGGTLSATSNHVWIGGQSPDPTNRPFPGRIDDVRIYTRALSASEIAALASVGCDGDQDCPQDSTGSAYCDGDSVKQDYEDWSCQAGTCASSTTTSTLKTCGSGEYCSGGSCHEQTGELQQLKLSSNGRFLVTGDGEPFFYLGDTAWRLPQMLTREEVDLYMQTRKEQGFTVVMVTLEGTSVDQEQANINAYGHAAYLNDDFTTPRVIAGDNNDYWDHLDYIISKAEESGLYVALMPIWSSNYYLDESTYRTIGTFVGNRYKDRKNIIWITGGDVFPEAGQEHLFQAIAEEITKAKTGSTSDSNDQVLFTFHPCGWYEDAGCYHSSSIFQGEDWLDLNGIQSGHWDMDEPPNLNYKYVERDYAKTPVKPTAEMESFYEGHHFENNPDNRRGDDYDVRRNAYWSVFAGGFGYTYGNNNVWAFYETSMGEFETHQDTNWYDALDSVGANDMAFLKNLMLSRPYLARIPDQSLITSSNPDDVYHIYATRSSDGDYAFVYVPQQGKSVTINTGKLSGTNIRSWWYNPRDGAHTDLGTATKGSSRTYTTPTISGPDWVLVIDDENRGYGEPGG